MTDFSRKFLAMSDDSEECRVALIYAGRRAKAVRAGLVMLRCARAPGLGGWIGLDQDISQDAVDAARLKAAEHAKLVEERTGTVPEVVVSDEDPLDAIRKVVEQDAAIRQLVLAAGSGRWGPGPLVSRLGKGRALAERPVAVTVVPGDLTDAQIDEMGGMPG
jgi:hypothetical protein